MKRYLLLVALRLAAVACAMSAFRLAGAEPVRPAAGRHFTFVLVHGAWSGGWSFKEVAQLLNADGHVVYRPTLTGLGERVHLANPQINLSTHINDVANVILWEDLHDVVLVGHSYSGAVIEGVADRVPERIKSLVFLDAAILENGESFFSAFGWSADRIGADGFISLRGAAKSGDALPHDVPQSGKTMSEPLKLVHADAVQKIPTTYILTVGKGKKPEQDNFYRFYERAKAHGWKTMVMEGNHDVHKSYPRELAEILKRVP